MRCGWSSPACSIAFPRCKSSSATWAEAVPFMLARANQTLSGRLALEPAQTRITLSIEEYFRRNFHITTSGFFTDPPLHCALETLGSDRILFAVDHPFSDGAEAVRFLERAAISDEHREKIAHGNAERWLGI